MNLDRVEEEMAAEYSEEEEDDILHIGKSNISSKCKPFRRNKNKSMSAFGSRRQHLYY